MVEHPSIVVAVATFRRPDCLGRLLPEVVRQVAAYPGAGSVVVVDNDPAGSARTQVEAYGASRVRYLHEPTPGIAAARNAALDGAGGAELLVFVDDDGLPLPGWLHHLTSHWVRWRCAGVAGPALPRFEAGEPDAWLLGCGVFDRVTRPTGTRLGGASTANLLLHLPTLRRLGVRFDEEFGLSGGSDTMLTHHLVKLGAELRWCDEAEVYDFHSADRMDRRWVLRRVFRTGNDWSRVALALCDSRLGQLAERVELATRGTVRIGRGLRRAARGALRASVADRAAGSCMVATGLGVIAGACGHVALEYRR